MGPICEYLGYFVQVSFYCYGQLTKLSALFWACPSEMRMGIWKCRQFASIVVLWKYCRSQAFPRVKFLSCYKHLHSFCRCVSSVFIWGCANEKAMFRFILPGIVMASNLYPIWNNSSRTSEEMIKIEPACLPSVQDLWSIICMLNSQWYTLCGFELPSGG